MSASQLVQYRATTATSVPNSNFRDQCSGQIIASDNYGDEIMKLLKCSIRTTLAALMLSIFPCLSTAQPENASAGSRTRADKADEITTASFDKPLLKKLIIEYTNSERKEAGLTALEADDALSSAAAKHSRDMARRDYFSHTRQRESEPDIEFEDRELIKKLGYKRTAENISLQPIVQSRRTKTRTLPSGETRSATTREFATYQEMAKTIVDSWMESRGHRKNILTPEFTLIGIGTATGDQDGQPYVWITQLFGRK